MGGILPPAKNSVVGALIDIFSTPNALDQGRARFEADRKKRQGQKSQASLIQRLTLLNQELANATQQGDTEKARLIQEEIAAVQSELSSLNEEASTPSGYAANASGTYTPIFGGMR